MFIVSADFGVVCVCVCVCVCVQIMAEIDVHMFHLFESPETASAQESVSTIIEYLRTNIEFYKDFLLKGSYFSFMKRVWLGLLDKIDAYLKGDDPVTPSSSSSPPSPTRVASYRSCGIYDDDDNRGQASSSRK